MTFMSRGESGTPASSYLKIGELQFSYLIFFIVGINARQEVIMNMANVRWKEIWELINFVQIGGAITIVGGLIGYFIGFFQLAQPCIKACPVGPLLNNCMNNCPNPFMYAFYGAIPGMIIAGVEWIIKKYQNPA